MSRCGSWKGGGKFLPKTEKKQQITYGDDWAFITIHFANQMVNLDRFSPRTAKNQRLHELLTWTRNVLVAPFLRYCRVCQSIAKHWRKNQCVPTLKY